MRASLLLLALVSASAVAQPVAIPGTRVSLTPPEGYVASERFAGFESERLSGSLMVIELTDAPLADLISGFTPEALAAQGILEAEVDTVSVGGMAATLVTGWQRAYGQTFRRWSLFTGDSLGVVLVNATLAEEASGADTTALVVSLMSLTLGAPPEDLFEGLPFTLDLPEALPERRRMGALVSASQATPDAGIAGGPLYMAGLGAAPLLGDLADLARSRILQTVLLTDFGEVETRPLAVGGRDGVEARVSALDEDTGIPITTILVLAPHTETGYVIVQATARTDAWEAWGPRFRAITESLVWTE